MMMKAPKGRAGFQKTQRGVPWRPRRPRRPAERRGPQRPCGPPEPTKRNSREAQEACGGRSGLQGRRAGFQNPQKRIPERPWRLAEAPGGPVSLQGLPEALEARRASNSPAGQPGGYAMYCMIDKYKYIDSQNVTIYIYAEVIANAILLEPKLATTRYS